MSQEDKSESSSNFFDISFSKMKSLFQSKKKENSETQSENQNQNGNQNSGPDATHTEEEKKSSSNNNTNTNKGDNFGQKAQDVALSFTKNITKLGKKIDNRFTMPGLLKQGRQTLEQWLITQSELEKAQAIVKEKLSITPKKLDNNKPKNASTNDNDTKNSNINNNTATPNDENNPNTTIANNNNNNHTNINTTENIDDKSSNDNTSTATATDTNDEKDEKTADNDNDNDNDSVDTVELKKTLPFACGIVLLSTVAGGFVHGVEGSTGIVIFRLDKGYEIDDNGNPLQRWSQPCAIAGGGVSAGFQIGISKIDQFIILTHPRHAKTFMGHGQFQVGAKAEAAIGGKGASAGGSVNVSDKFVSEMVCYTLKAKGLLAGIKVSMTGMGINKDVNGKYYNNKDISIDDIINDSMTLPPDNKDYDKIIQILKKYFPQYPPPKHPYFQENAKMGGIMDVINAVDDDDNNIGNDNNNDDDDDGDIIDDMLDVTPANDINSPSSKAHDEGAVM